MTNSGGWRGSYCSRRPAMGSHQHSQPYHCSGPVIDIFNNILADSLAQTNMTATFIGGPIGDYPDAFPEEVLRLNPSSKSSFQHCTAATGTGYVDICLGAFSMGPSRVQLSKFITLWSDSTILVTTAFQQEASLWEKVTASFKPFQLATWALILGFVLFAAGCIGVVEYSMDDAGSSSRVFSLSFGCKIASSFYEGMMSLVNGGSSITARQPGSRLMNIGLGLVILISTTSYTANLASQLIVQHKQITSVGGLDDIIMNPSLKVCSTSYTRLMARGVPAEQIVKIKGRRNVLLAIGTDACQAGETFLEDLNYHRANGDFCNLTRVGDPVGSVNWGVPVSDRAYKTMAWLWAQAEYTGENMQALSAYPYNGMSSSVCSSIEPLPTGLAVDHMAGPVVIAALFVVAGACLQARPFYLSRRQLREGILPN